MVAKLNLMEFAPTVTHLGCWYYTFFKDNKMISIKSTTMSGIKKEAVSISKKNPNMYVTVHNCFGLYASLAKRLHVHAPGDVATLLGIDWYVLNGKVKTFTTKMKIADEKATPFLN